MKILYSQIKELVPGLKKDPKKVSEILTLIGFMRDGFDKVRYQNRNDYLLSFEIRQNRPDCLSVIGLAKEVAAYYGLKVKMPRIFPAPSYGTKKLDIKVNAKNCVKRILAVEIKNLTNKESPKWLKEFLSLYEINSINLLVDLSNYVMILTGYPSHLLDLDKINGTLCWSLNNDFKEITTLDGSKVKLKKGELIIKDNKNILALAGIVGGKIAAIDFNSKSIIAEMAVYDSFVVRKNSRDLKITTEASNRLGKDLDPRGSEFAFKLLISLIIKNCKGKIESELFDFYLDKNIIKPIKFDPRLSGLYAGVDILKSKSLKILKNLGFEVKPLKDIFFVKPPVGRTDISLTEDLIEEILRMYGYDKIPKDKIPKLEIVKNITPKNIYLAEKIRDILSYSGFDEILSCPLTKKGDNLKFNYLNWEIISTQNSVNEEYPDLRQSMAVGLVNQLNEYLKKGVRYVRIFEIGKIFGKKGNNYKEEEMLGVLMHIFSDDKSLPLFKEVIERLLRTIGFNEIYYLDSEIKPEIANPYSCWDIKIKEETVGIIYKLKPLYLKQNTYFSEINLGKIVKLLEKTYYNPAVELSSKLVVLDANVEIKNDKSIDDYLKKIRKKIKEKNIWTIEVVDRFLLKEKIRYTIRVSYKNLSDKEAKKIHLEAFGLSQRSSEAEQGFRKAQVVGSNPTAGLSK